MSSPSQYIVLYVSRLGIGGIQTFVVQLAEALSMYPNVQVAIFCHHPELADRSTPPFPEKVALWTLSTNPLIIKIVNKLRNWIKLLFPQFDLKECLIRHYFLKKLRQHNNNIVIHNNIEIGDQLAYLAQKKLGVPYVTTLHGAYKHILNKEVSLKEKEKLRQTLTRLLDTASSVIYLSERNLEPFEMILGDISKKRNVFARIFNGLKKVEELTVATTSDTIVFGLIARGVHYKGWEEAILATIRLVQKYPNKGIVLKLYGESEYLNELAKQYQVSKDFILFCGATTRPLDVVPTFMVGLLPTYLPQEEMPFTIIEYLACGKPVIATSSGAIPEMLEVQGEIAGEIIPFGKNGHADVLALEKAMEKFLLDTVYWRNKSNVAKKAFEKFDIKNTAEQYYQLYQNAIKQ